jgi:hypothetical protein
MNLIHILALFSQYNPVFMLVSEELSSIQGFQLEFPMFFTCGIISALIITWRNSVVLTKPFLCPSVMGENAKLTSGASLHIVCYCSLQLPSFISLQMLNSKWYPVSTLYGGSILCTLHVRWWSVDWSRAIMHLLDLCRMLSKKSVCRTSELGHHLLAPGYKYALLWAHVLWSYCV